MKKNDIDRSMIALGEEFKSDELNELDVQKIADKLALARVERQELQKFMLNEKQLNEVYPMDDILEHYLQGSTNTELAKLFPKVPTGAFIYFQIKYRWPELRQRFIDDLQYGTKIKAMQAKHKTIAFLSTMVNTFIAKNQKGLMKYAASGGHDDSDLPARFKINDFNKLAQYMRVIQQAGEINEKSSSDDHEESQRPTIHIQTENVTVKNPDVEAAAKKSEKFLKDLYAKDKEEK